MHHFSLPTRIFFWSCQQNTFCLQVFLSWWKFLVLREFFFCGENFYGILRIFFFLFLSVTLKKFYFAVRIFLFCQSFNGLVRIFLWLWKFLGWCENTFLDVKVFKVQAFLFWSENFSLAVRMFMILGEIFLSLWEFFFFKENVSGNVKTLVFLGGCEIFLWCKMLFCYWLWELFFCYDNF